MPEAKRLSVQDAYLIRNKLHKTRGMIFPNSNIPIVIVCIFTNQSIVSYIWSFINIRFDFF
jgi:hypothetical protein